MGETSGGFVLEKVSGNTSSILQIVTDVGNAALNNEVVLIFFTLTMMSFGVRLLRKLIGAFGRGR